MGKLNLFIIFLSMILSFQDSTEIFSYWTKERMLKAIPMDLIITNDLESFPLTQKNRTETKPVPPEYYNRHPYKRAGRLFFEAQGKFFKKL
jgi:hypothetical protein